MTLFIFYFIILSIYIFGIVIAWNIILILEEKRNEIFIRNKKKLLEDDFSDNIEITVSFMSLCSSLIDNEVGKLISTYLQSNKKYEYIKVDEDVKIISNNIYSAFKEKIIDNSSLIITEDFIMKYIIEETLNRLLTVAKDYNKSLLE